MKKLLAVLLGLAAIPAFAGNTSSGTTTGVTGNGNAFTGTAQASFGTHIVTLNVGMGGNSLNVQKQPDQGGNTSMTSSSSLSIGRTLGGGFGSTGGTGGTTAGPSGF